MLLSHVFLIKVASGEIGGVRSVLGWPSALFRGTKHGSQDKLRQDAAFL